MIKTDNIVFVGLMSLLLWSVFIVAPISLFWFAVYKIFNGGGFWYWVLAFIILGPATAGVFDPRYVRPGEMSPIWTFAGVSIILWVIYFLITGDWYWNLL